MTTGRTVATRLLVTAVVAILVVGLATLVPLLAPSGGVDDGPAHPEYDAEELAPERLESAGVINPSGDVGVVLFDRSHGNRFKSEDIAPLVRAIDRAGGEVQFSGITGGFESGLQEADVLVVIDPANSYNANELDAIEQFVDDGGRVLVLGEPNRKVVEAEGLMVNLATRRAKVATIGSRFGVSFGSQYVYDMENNDGNFKDVVVSPPGRTDVPAVNGVDEVALYTSAAVDVNRGTVLLRTDRTAERGNDAGSKRYPVAVMTNGGDVIAVGDKTFVNEAYYAVGDNDVFIQRLVEFMAGANHNLAVNPDQPEDSPSSALRSVA